MIHRDYLIYLRRAGHFGAYSVHCAFRLPAPSIIVLCYHSLVDDGWRYGVGLDDFKRQIRHVLKFYRPITLGGLADRMVRKIPADRPSFVLTFDDGYQDILAAAPFLDAENIKPAVFTVASPDKADRKQLGTDRALLSREELQGLARAGWEIGCHSASHGDFFALDATRLEQEIADSKADLENDLGIPIRYFAYPRGRYDGGIIDSVRQAGYALGLTSDDQPFRIDADPFLIPRIGVDRTHSFFEFKSLLNYPSIYFRNLIRRIA